MYVRLIERSELTIRSFAMDGAARSINWGACRQGVSSTLPRFDSLSRENSDLVRSYQTVLDNDETFSQYFSDQPLHSYGIEASLREELGVGPPCLPDPENPSDARQAMISWATIFREGDFEKQPEGGYICRVQGKIIEIDETMHKTIMISRRAFPPAAQTWPIPDDLERELELGLSIEVDVDKEIKSQIECVERLQKLQLSLKKRRKVLEGIRDPSSVEKVERRTPEPSYAKPPTSTQTLTSPSLTASSGHDIACGEGKNTSNAHDHSTTDKHDSNDSNDQHDNKRVSTHAVQSIKNEQTTKGLIQQTSHEVISIADTCSSTPSTPPEPSSLPASSLPATVPSTVFTPSAAFMPINRPIEHIPSKRLQGSQPTQGGTSQTPKRFKSAHPTSASDLEVLQHGQHLAMWNEQQNTSSPSQNTTTEGKPPKEKKRRERNNFTEYEKQHAPQWIRQQIDAAMVGTELERAYTARFGTHHQFYTLKAFVDRMERKAAEQEKRIERLAEAKKDAVNNEKSNDAGDSETGSKIVVLKVRFPPTSSSTQPQPHGTPPDSNPIPPNYHGQTSDKNNRRARPIEPSDRVLHSAQRP
ncbi:unnamed protein product [Penicillium salamii]|uniref:Uncharacterized protein n=1 Tax=Penicillium salamii TaxID=1612424 RepID=A0A9W4JYK0_9EURO|nr:unnamed protein product [Penicillium salamii]CAG8259717.1 unnamed protein product [Penicillium salamii]CAG8375589.1 unnamed protein product [Penicillium salamii]CAG8406254.1 unnamed protein product [Penicillium salamii]CAG8412314.1 unnamed protein product [Penicillium salamii]